MAELIVVGAGAAGLMAAGAACRLGHRVTVLEHSEMPGKKILVTGKGRCNVTNDCDENTFLQNVRTNPRFLFSSIHAFPPSATMELFQELGVPLKTERGRRVFPVSDRAEDIRAALLRYAADANIVMDGAKSLVLEEGRCTRTACWWPPAACPTPAPAPLATATNWQSRRATPSWSRCPACAVWSARTRPAKR